MLAKWTLLSNLIITAYLTGLIWVIQVLHYPSFARFGEEEFLNFHPFHTERITWIVMLPMLLELGLSLYLIYERPLSVPFSGAIFLGVLTLIIWLSTFFWAIPLHERLGSGQNLDLIAQLVGMNWIRTFAWTLRTLLLSYYLSKLL